MVIILFDAGSVRPSVKKVKATFGYRTFVNECGENLLYLSHFFASSLNQLFFGLFRSSPRYYVTNIIDNWNNRSQFSIRPIHVYSHFLPATDDELLGDFDIARG